MPRIGPRRWERTGLRLVISEGDHMRRSRTVTVALVLGAATLLAGTPTADASRLPTGKETGAIVKAFTLERGIGVRRSR